MKSVVNGVRVDGVRGRWSKGSKKSVVNLYGLERCEILLRGVNTDREVINMDG